MSGVTLLFPLYAFMGRTRTTLPLASYKIFASHVKKHDMFLQLPKYFMVKLENIKNWID